METDLFHPMAAEYAIARDRGLMASLVTKVVINDRDCRMQAFNGLEAPAYPTMTAQDLNPVAHASLTTKQAAQDLYQDEQRRGPQGSPETSTTDSLLVLARVLRFGRVVGDQIQNVHNLPLATNMTLRLLQESWSSMSMEQVSTRRDILRDRIQLFAHILGQPKHVHNTLTSVQGLYESLFNGVPQTSFHTVKAVFCSRCEDIEQVIEPDSYTHRSTIHLHRPGHDEGQGRRVAMINTFFEAKTGTEVGRCGSCRGYLSEQETVVGRLPPTLAAATDGSFDGVEGSDCSRLFDDARVYYRSIEHAVNTADYMPTAVLRVVGTGTNTRRTLLFRSVPDGVWVAYDSTGIDGFHTRSAPTSRSMWQHFDDIWDIMVDTKRVAMVVYRRMY